MKKDDRVAGRDYFTAREWATLRRVGASGSSLVARNACVHGVLFGLPCTCCVDAEKAYRKRR